MKPIEVPNEGGAAIWGAFFVHGADDHGERILLHSSRPRWLRGNATLVEIAQGLARTAGEVEPVVAELSAAYGVAQESLREDVRRVREALRKQDLLDPEQRGEIKPRSLYLILTERCNLACAHCCGAYPGPRDMPLDQALVLAESLIAAQGRLLTLSGGEPLLHAGLPRLLERIGKRIPVQFCTNGLLIEPDWAAWVSAHLEARFQISLDGPTAACHDAIRGEGAFEGALRGIRRLQDAGLGDRIVVAATVQAHNRQALPALVQRAAELGVTRLRFIPLRPEGRAAAHWDARGESWDMERWEPFFRQFLDHPGQLPKHLDFNCGLSGFGLHLPDDRNDLDHWCPVGTQLSVDPLGRAYPCTNLMAAPFLLGNVFEEGLLAIFASPKLRELHAAKYLRKDRIEACGPCAWRGFCQSGCMADAWDETGSVWAADRMCRVRQGAYGRAFDRVLAAKGREKP